jgi:CheY-like chemotaxis protein
MCSLLCGLSSCKGSGSRFRVQLCLGNTSDPAEPAPLKLSLQKQLLLVIRNATLRSILSRQLTEWSFHVVAVGSSTEALPLPREQFALVLTDVDDRPDDRLLLVESDVPTILLRQGGHEERLKRAPAMNGSSILLCKPVRTRELYDALCRAVNPLKEGDSPLLSLLILSQQSLGWICRHDNTRGASVFVSCWPKTTSPTS